MEDWGLGGVVGAAGAAIGVVSSVAIRVASSAAIRVTSSVAVGIASRIGRAASSGARAAYWGIDVIASWGVIGVGICIPGSIGIVIGGRVEAVTAGNNCWFCVGVCVLDLGSIAIIAIGWLNRLLWVWFNLFYSITIISSSANSLIVPIISLSIYWYSSSCYITLNNRSNIVTLSPYIVIYTPLLTR